MEETPFARECDRRGWVTPQGFLRAYEQAAQLIGEETTLTDRQYRRWRQVAPPRPRARAWRVLYAMFGVSPLELGFPGPLPEPPDEEEVTVDRRAFVADSLGATSGIALSRTGVSGAIGTAHVAELRAGLRSLISLDDAYGSGDVLSLTARHLRRIRRVIETCSYPDVIGRQLQLLAGETAEHCAWLAFDAEDHEVARGYWGEALSIANMLRDEGLAILVLAAFSLQALREGRPREGHDFARAARQRAHVLGSPRLVSLIAVREARALAQMGDVRAGRRVLAEAMRLADRNTGRPAPEWAAFHGHAELDFAQGLLNAEAGHHKAAIPFFRASLAHQDRSAYGRNWTLYRLTLARSLAQNGEAEEAAAEVMGTPDHVSELRSGRVRARLGEVRAALASMDTAAAREAVEAISACASA